jgi:hypothetical protein
MPKPVNAALPLGPAAGTRSKVTVTDVVGLPPTRKSRKQGTGTKATGATVSTKALVSLEEVASEGTGEDGGSEAAFKESGVIKSETMSCEDESGKSKSSEWKFGGDSAHGRVTIPDQYAPPIFTGKPSEDAEKWVSYFRRFTACQGWTEEQARQFFPLCLKGKAFDWYENQEDELKYALHDLLDGFMTYFSPTPLDRMLEADNVFNRTQREEETVRDYVQTMITLSKRVENVDPKTLRFLVIKGFRPHIKGYILQHQEQCKTLDDLVKFGRVAEATAVDPTREASNFTRQMEDNFKALSAKLDNLSRERADRPAQSVRFQDTGRRPTSSPQRRFEGDGRNRARQSPGRSSAAPPRFQNARDQPQERQPGPCSRCGRTNCRGGDRCAAIGRVCRRCNRPNHFQVVCRSAPRPQ